MTAKKRYECKSCRKKGFYPLEIDHSDRCFVGVHLMHATGDQFGRWEGMITDLDEPTKNIAPDYYSGLGRYFRTRIDCCIETSASR